MFKFSVRDLLWLTVVVALGVGWWVDHNQSNKRAADRRRETQEQIDKLAEENSQLSKERDSLAHIAGHMPHRMFPEKNIYHKQLKVTPSSSPAPNPPSE
jgi:uncharacterized protein HemX